MPTEAQKRALRTLASRDWCSPAEIGYGMTADRKWPMKPQGAGRLGGRMGTKLVEMGLAARHYTRWPGRGLHSPGYQITPAGRRAIAEST